MHFQFSYTLQCSSLTLVISTHVLCINFAYLLLLFLLAFSFSIRVKVEVNYPTAVDKYR
jgi:hypothetical protein